MICNKRGQLDQIITSIIVLFASVVLMGIFVVVSGNIGALLGAGDSDDEINSRVSDLSIESIDSRVLMGLFLADVIDINGEDVLIVDSIKSMGDISKGSTVGLVFLDVSDLDIARIVEQKFHEKYGCQDKNQLLIRQVIKTDIVGAAPAGEARKEIKAHIDYPDNFGSLPLPVFHDSFSIPAKDLPQPQENSHKQNLRTDKGNEIIVFVTENERC